MVRHDFHSLYEYALLLCCGVPDVLEPGLHIANKNSTTILRAEHDVIRQVEDGSYVLGIAAVFRLLNVHVRCLPPYLYPIVKCINALTCRLKSAARRAIYCRVAIAVLEINKMVEASPRRRDSLDWFSTWSKSLSVQKFVVEGL